MLLSYMLLYDVRVCICIYRHVFLLLLVCVVLLLQVQLHAAAVRHRVPDCENCCCGSLHLIPVFLSLHHSNMFLF